MANTIVPAATNTAVMIIGVVKRCCLAPKAKHQTELIRLYTNPPFDIAARYAQLLTVVFVTMTYGAGLPLLYFFAAAYMLFTYWADKIVLLWGSKRPPAYDTTIPREASQYMLYSVAIHCVFAIWMFGQPCTFPSAPLGGSLASVTEQATSTAANSGGAYGSMATDSGLVERLTKESTWMIFLLLIFCIGLWGVWTVLWILGGTLGEFGKCILLCLCPKATTRVSVSEVDSASDKVTWDQAQVIINRSCPPASYRMEKHPNFRDHAKFVRPSTVAVEQGSSVSSDLFQKRVPPLDEDIALKFLIALRDEYVREVSQAVGSFIKSAELSKEDEGLLVHKYEKMVRSAAEDEKEQAINEIAERWGLTLPPP